MMLFSPQCGDVRSVAFQLSLRPVTSGSEYRIDCPYMCKGANPKKREASVRAHDGVWHCFACGESGNLLQMAREEEESRNPAKTPTFSAFKAQREAFLAKRNGARVVARKSNQKKKAEAGKKSRGVRRNSKGILNFRRAIGVLRQSTFANTSNKTRWAKERNWPGAFCQHFAGLDGVVAVRSQMTSDWHANRLIEMCHPKGGPAWNLLFLLYDQKGRPISGSRRAFSLPEDFDGPKSMELSGRSVGGLTWRSFGSMEDALEAARRGEPIYLVEGAPDWGVAASWCRLTGQGAALGAISHTWLPKIARELQRRLRDEDISAEVILVPHMGDHNDVGENSAHMAAQILRRCALVRYARPTILDHKGKGDLSYVLEQGGVAALEAMFDAAQNLFPANMTLTELREELQAILKRCLEEGGRHAVRAPTGAGKTHALVELLIRKAYEEDLSIAVCLPTQKLRSEVTARLREVCARLALPVVVQELLGRDHRVCAVPEYANAASRALPQGSKRVCGGCPLKDNCAYMRQFWQQKGQITVRTHAQALGYDYVDEETGEVHHKQDRHDIIVVDESPIDTMIGEITCTLEDLNLGRRFGDLLMSDAAWLSVSNLFARDRAEFEDIAPLLPTGSLRASGTHETGEHFWSSAHRLFPGRPEDHLDRAPEWRLWAALEACCNAGWKGVYLRAGVLHLPVPKKLPYAKVATIYADATVTPNIAKSVLPGCSYHELTSDLPSQVEVIQVNCGASKSDLRSNRGKARQSAIHLRFESSKTLHITHKDVIQNPEDYPWVEQVGDVIHFGSAEARGCDKYRDYDTVILDQFYVPQAAVRVLAQRMEIMATSTGAFFSDYLSGPGGDDDFEGESDGRGAEHAARGDFSPFPHGTGSSLAVDWIKEARHHAEFAHLIQGQGRIRPYCGDPKRIILLDDRKWPGLVPDRVISADVEVWNQTGTPTGKDCLLEGVRRAVTSNRGVFFPALDFTQQDTAQERSGLRPGSVSSGVPRGGVKAGVHGDVQGSMGTCKEYMATTQETLRAPSFSLGSLALSWATNALNHFFGGSWEACAKEAGLRCTHLKTNRGGALVVLYQGTLSRHTLLRALSGRAQWFLWEGKRVYLPGSKLYKAASRLLSDGEEIDIKSLSERAGVSLSTVRRWFSGMGLSLEEWLEGLSEGVQVGEEGVDEDQRLFLTLPFAQAFDLLGDEGANMWFKVNSNILV